MRFRLERCEGTAGAFHGRELLDEPQPWVVAAAVSADALVLGSSQRLEVIDQRACAAAGVEVVRRRSGGGAVLVEPGAMCWFDVVVPAAVAPVLGCPDDVAGSMIWLGRHIAATLAARGVAGVAVHEGRLEQQRWSRLVCFAGVGPGEVLAGGRDGPLCKLVGISQRRRRAGARFQCMVHTAWNPARLTGLLAEPRPRVDELPPVAVVSPEVAAALPQALVDSLNGGEAVTQGRQAGDNP